ncbi:MAG: SH3 domain-containing protein [Caldilineales bacterium]
MLNRKYLPTLVGVTFLLAITLSACGPAASPTPEATATRPFRPTFTPTVVSTDTPTPTDTPLPTDTPTPLPTDTPTPEAPMAVVIGDEESNLRAGPGTNYDTVGQVARDTELEIIAKNAAGDWYQVCCVDGQQGWIVARLVEVTGDPNLVQVAANIPAPPTDTPVPTRPPAPPTSPPQPTSPPAPTNTPVPAFKFAREAMEPRVNTNPIVSVFGALFNQARDLSKPVTGYKMVVQAPSGEQREAEFGPVFLRGDPGLAGEFIYNAKVEFPLSEGTFRAWVADGGGNQVSEAWDLGVSGEMRTFLTRWKEQ